MLRGFEPGEDEAQEDYLSEEASKAYSATQGAFAGVLPSAECYVLDYLEGNFEDAIKHLREYAEGGECR